jgi:FkbM family methyltransferase
MMIGGGYSIGAPAVKGGACKLGLTRRKRLPMDPASPSVLTPRSPARPPVLFKLARAMIRADIPGGWRLWRSLFERGALAVTAEYVISGPARSTPMRVPLDREDSSWSDKEIAGYGAYIVDATLRAAERLKGPFTLIDCGADIGMISASFLRATARVEALIAYEPNPNSFSYLSQSAAMWGIPVALRQAAVSDYSGRGRLVASSADASEHARYIIEDPKGPIAVRKVDEETVDPAHAVLLKIDVEGEEERVARGALATLRSARDFVVVFEAHPRVAERTGNEPGEVLRLLMSVRPIEITIAELPDVRIDPARPFFEQLGSHRNTICNVICVSR